jgi:hypothetical protein
MMVARCRRMWRARSRTKFLPLSFQGGTTGFDTNKIDAMGARVNPGGRRAPFSLHA